MVQLGTAPGSRYRKPVGIFAMTKTRTLLQLSVIVSLALTAGACSTIADLDPTGLLGGDSTPAPAGQFPDANTPQASDASVGTTPDLAALPSRPVTSSPAQRQQQAQSLAADGAQVQYSAEALRGGTEAAAPVPGAPPPPSALALAAPPPVSAALPAAENDAPPTAEPAPPPPAAPVAAPAPRAPSSQTAAVPEDAAPTASAPVAAAAAALPPGAQPAVPAVPANTPVRRGTTAMAAVTPSDAELGFKPSEAPALDPSISQWVPAPIVARYRQTASTAGVSASAAAVPPRGQGAADVSGAVIANLGAIPASPGAAVAPGGVTPTAVIYFPGDGTALSAAARNELRGAVKAFKAAGGTGTIRVVGHSSSRTANMPIEKHLETIFAKSQARANAVAQELIHQGVPADKVLVEAVGDSQPVYYESMPKGEDGNRRAEVFVQS